MSFSFIPLRHVTQAAGLTLTISLSKPNPQVLRLQAWVILSGQLSLSICAELYTKFKTCKLDIHTRITYPQVFLDTPRLSPAYYFPLTKFRVLRT